MKKLLIIGGTIFTISAMSLFAGQAQGKNNNANASLYSSAVPSLDTVPLQKKDTTGKKKPKTDSSVHEIKLKF